MSEYARTFAFPSSLSHLISSRHHTHGGGDAGTLTPGGGKHRPISRKIGVGEGKKEKNLVVCTHDRSQQGKSAGGAWMEERGAQVLG